MFFDIFKTNLDYQISIATNFEQRQSNLNIRACSVCHEISLTLTENICMPCQKFPDPSSLDLNNPANHRLLNPKSAQNNLHPGIVPECLKGLTLMEQILISPVKPYIYMVYLPSGGQLGYNGHVINFNQNIDHMVRELPRSLACLSEFILSSGQFNLIKF